MKPASDNVCRARPLLGTFVEVGADGARRSDIDVAIDAAFGVVAEVHRLMSFHEPASDVSRLNRGACRRPVAVHPWTYEVLEMALDLHAASASLFDITIAPVLQNRGLLPRRGGDRASSATGWRAAGAIELLPGHRVRFRDRSVRIDLGGIAKGFAVDQAVAALRAGGMERGLVNAGGDLVAFGSESRTVHIRDPNDPTLVLCGVEVRNEALASSGNRFDPLRSLRATAPAIIDPNTREPACTVQGATVRAPSCMVADALTKVVMIAAEAALPVLKYYRARAMFVCARGDVYVTTDWQNAVNHAA